MQNNKSPLQATKREIMIILTSNGKNDGELRSCVKVKVAVLGSPSLIDLMVCECGREATLNLNSRRIKFDLLIFQRGSLFFLVQDFDFDLFGSITSKQANNNNNKQASKLTNRTETDRKPSQ